MERSGRVEGRKEEKKDGKGGGSMKAESAISKLSVSTLSGGHHTNQGCVYSSVVTVPITDSLYTAAGTHICML